MSLGTSIPRDRDRKGKQALNIVAEEDKAMKKLSVVGLLIALAVAPVANAFAQSSAPQIPPGFPDKEGLGPDAIGTDLTFLEFHLLGPNVNSPTLTLTFILAVTSLANAGQNINVQTRTLSGSTFNRTDPYASRQTRFFSAADVSCPNNDVCQMIISALEPAGNVCFIIFDSLLIIFDTSTNDIVAMLQPSQAFTQCVP
jgi:hypothetical protein